MERVRESRARQAKMLMELPGFHSAIEAIRDRLKVSPEDLRGRVRVFLHSDGTPAYSLLEKHLREMNPEIDLRWFRDEIKCLLRRFSRRSWWWEEWLVRYVLFNQERIPDEGYKVGQRLAPTGQDEMYFRVDLDIPGVAQALSELSPLIKFYRRWFVGVHTERLRSIPNFERDLGWWHRVRICGQSPEEICAEWEDETQEQWDSEKETLMKEQGMKEVEAEDYLLAQWEKTGRLKEGPDAHVIRRAVQRLDERYQQLFGIDPRDLGYTLSGA